MSIRGPTVSKGTATMIRNDALPVTHMQQTWINSTPAIGVTWIAGKGRRAVTVSFMRSTCTWSDNLRCYLGGWQTQEEKEIYNLHQRHLQIHLARGLSRKGIRSCRVWNDNQWADFFTREVCKPDVVTPLLDWTWPIFEWTYIARLVVENGHQKDIASYTMRSMDLYMCMLKLWTSFQ